jgi:hypothetical protein
MCIFLLVSPMLSFVGLQLTRKFVVEMALVHKKLGSELSTTNECVHSTTVQFFDFAMPFCCNVNV